MINKQETQYLVERKNENWDVFYASNHQTSIELNVKFKSQQALDKLCNSIGKITQLHHLCLSLTNIEFKAKFICLNSLSHALSNLLQLRTLQLTIDGKYLTQIKHFQNIFKGLQYCVEFKDLELLIEWNLIDIIDLRDMGSQLSQLKNLKFLQLSNTSDSGLQDNVITILNDSLQYVTQLSSLNIDLKTEKQIIFLNLLHFMPLLGQKQFKIQDKQITFCRNKRTQRVTKLQCEINSQFDEVETRWLQQGLSQLINLTSLAIDLEQSSRISTIKDNNSFLNLIPLKKLKIHSKHKLNEKLFLKWFSNISSQEKLSQLHFEFEEECSIRLLVELSNYISKYTNLHKLVIKIKHYQVNQDYNLVALQLANLPSTVEYLHTNISPLLFFNYLQNINNNNNKQQLKSILFNHVLSNKNEIEDACKQFYKLKSLDQFTLSINCKDIKYSKLNFNLANFQQINCFNLLINIYNIEYLFELLEQMNRIQFCKNNYSYSLTITFCFDNKDRNDEDKRISVQLRTRKNKKGQERKNEVILIINENQLLKDNNSEQLSQHISQLINVYRLSIQLFEMKDKSECQNAAIKMIKHIKQLHQISVFDLFISNNKLSERIHKLSYSLQTFNNIRFCTLKIGSDNGIKTDGAFELGRGIACCKQLTSLILSIGRSNLIQNEGVIGLFEGIQQLTLLQKLQFVVQHHNLLQKESFEIAVKGCSSLSNLYDISILLEITDKGSRFNCNQLFAQLQNIKCLTLRLGVIADKSMLYPAIKQIKKLVLFKVQHNFE